MNWQTLAVTLTVGLATISLLRRVVRIFRTRSRSTCGACSGCPGELAGAKAIPLVSLGLGQQPPRSHGESAGNEDRSSIGRTNE